MNLLLMCDGRVGTQIARWLLANYPGDIGAVVTMEVNEAFKESSARSIPSFTFQSESRLHSALSHLAPFDLGVLAWWPKLVSRTTLTLSKDGFINTHPSLLPHNRGKHYNFWALVEGAPFGVTLHFVDEGIDSGDIVAQRPIAWDWEDTGQTLYEKASVAMVELFKVTYPEVREGKVCRVPQELDKGSLHYARELCPASEIDLERRYSARELLNLLRARTFAGHPACRFTDNGATYEVTVNIKRKPA